MRKLVVAIAVLWGLAINPQVWAQCQPTNSPTLDFSNSKTVAPNQVPFAAVTVNMSAPGATGTFHKGTFGVGTQVTVNWIGYNIAPFGGSTVPLQFYYQWDNSGWVKWWTPTAMGGNGQFTVTSDMLGHNIYIKLVGAEKSGSGSFTATTQDIAKFYVDTGASGARNVDGIPSNNYVMVSLNYTGTPNIPYQTTCPNAAEKDMVPTAQLQLANTTSGENRNGVTLQGATTVVGQPVSAIAYDYISWLPGDVITTESGGFVYCSALGDFWNTLENPMVEPAITRVSWNPSTHATKYYCTPRSSPPDYQGPAYVPTSWKDPITGQGPAGFMDWEAIGVSFMGPWLFPYSINGASGRNVAGLYPPVVPDCTNSAAGIYPPVFPY